MRKMKKFLSLLLVVAFALSIMIPTASAAQFSDVDSTYRYYNAVENLAALKIINGMGDGTFAPDKTVKRSEFAKIVCIGIVKTGEVAPTAGSGFTDVAADHWASGYIKVAAAAGIINGMGDGTFAPDADVTYEQAVKMLVCALGYDAQAQARGGYPNGYITVAGTLKLLREVVDGTVGQGAHRGLIAKLVDNALNVKVVDPLTGKTSSSVSSLDKTKTEDGQIVSIYGTTLEYGEESPCKRDQIAVALGGDVEIFSIEELNIDPNEWLGRYVTIYYEEDSGRDYQELTNIREMAGSNDETTISLSDISEYDETTVEYMTEDEEYEEIDVNSDAIIMLNGSPIDTESKSLSDVLDANINESGTIRFLDAEGEGSASIVFLMVYDTIVVSSITKNEFKVYDKIVNGKTEILDEDSRSTTITFTKDGKPAEFSNITTNNILSIAKNEAGNKIDVLISANTVNGTISEIDGDCTTLVINNKTYKVAKSYESEAQKLFANDVAVKLYLDAFGKIAFAEISTSATNYKYAYLVGAESSGGTEEEFKIKVYNISSSSNITPTYLSINLDDGVRVNGERMRD
ncbi:MAG: S-layer homology domain-containing protein, partial [Clostridia bacterium]|nr:S-layer homology domain-containing protein [Clostridia bacterium]